MSRKRTWDDIMIACEWCNRSTRNPVGCPVSPEEPCRWILNFCSWECAAAYSYSAGSRFAQERHNLLEQHAGRTVMRAPWYMLLDVHGGKLTHEEFLASTRIRLTPDEQALAMEQDAQSFGDELMDSKRYNFDS